MTQEKSKCIYCERGSDDVPLLPFEYRGSDYKICPAHFPVLIHKPQNLADKLSGTEEWGVAAEH